MLNFGGSSVAVLLATAFLTNCALANDDYVHYPSVNKHYKFHRAPKQWFEARRTCRSEGGQLALPENDAEAKLLVDHFNANYPASALDDVVHKDYVLIGFHDAFRENEYVTLRGESLQYYFHKWGHGQPDNSGNEDCGSLHRAGVINDFPCSVPAVFACQKEKEKDEVRSVCVYDRAYKCDEFLDSCYKLHWNAQTWPEARATCASEGGHLAIVKNKQIEKFLANMFNDAENLVDYVTYKDCALIGFHDSYREGSYVTVEDDDLNDGYVNWSPNQPDNAGRNGENCGCIMRSGAINDFPCHIAAVFMCERKNGIDIRFNPSK